MAQSNKRALTLALAAVGIVMLVLGGVMLATFPRQAGAFPFQHMWAQGQLAPQSPLGAAPGQPGQGTAPDGQGGAPGSPQAGPQAGAQGGPQAQGFVPGWGPGWYGYHHGWFMRGPRLGGFFGGGILILVLVIIAISFFARRAWYWGDGAPWRHGGPDRGFTAEEILRRKFAQGDITEEEYKSRLSALGK